MYYCGKSIISTTPNQSNGFKKNVDDNHILIYHSHRGKQVNNNDNYCKNTTESS